MKFFKIFIIFCLFVQCKHPDFNEDERYKGTIYNSQPDVQIEDEEIITTLSIPEVVEKENHESINDDITEQEFKKENKKTIIKMHKNGGIYEIPIEINGVEMSFIFDTGASIISISTVEVGFLYKQGKITEDDFLGTANFTNANGEISEGTIINLKTVKIGDFILYNVEASVVPNLKAPLLLGQTALSRFAKVSIDYGNEELILE